ncbi:Arginine permease [Lachnellula subtilissima]|uniref:Arginine permease n=1 Tax=Lachnellula subtilissima TaxID=602034 RepID=A0A8H8U5U9_9HELO|nr:Arginine permease [Lachnellula subtilissima]
MDHEKLQAVSPQVFEYNGMSTQSTASPEPLTHRAPSIDEPVYIEDRRERRGESVWRVLKERHINMIAFSGTIGNGLFLGSGRALASAGPGGAVLSYILVGTIISSVISCLGEMTALMPVNAPYFGEFEYAFGSFKIAFITMLILLMVVLDTITPRADAYYDRVIGTSNWNSPYTFFNHAYRVKDEDGNLQRTITGGVGTFLGVWTTFVSTMFSYVGMDIVAATAAESKALSDSESMKMAARKINIRIVTLYALALLTASFVVPSNHPFINGGGQSVGSHSVFIIAVVEAGIPMAAHFFNAVFVFSSFTCAINSMYVASRVLHTLALRDQTGPDFITERLKRCRSGVPVRAVLVTAAIMMIGFMGRTGAPGERLGELATNCTVSCLIVYVIICATYLCFFKTLKEAKLYGNASEFQTACYDRSHPRYPYKSHGQWLKASYGLVASILLVVFNGIDAFLERPFDTRKFIASYISVPVFLLLLLGYKVRKHGFAFSQWGPERSNDLRNTVQTASEIRKGRLEFPDEGLTKKKRSNVP